MLDLNQLASFGLPITQQPVSIRYVGTYTYTAGAVTSISVNIPDTDWGPIDDSKQILIKTASEVITITQVTFAGVRAGKIGNDSNGACYWWSPPQYWPTVGLGVGTITLSLTAGSNIGESQAFQVYEVIGADLLIKAPTFNWTISTGTSIPLHGRQPAGSLLAAAAHANTDTTTFSWSSLTEDNDSDVGAARGGLARSTNAPTTSADWDETITLSASGQGSGLMLAVCPPQDLSARAVRHVLVNPGAGVGTFSSGVQDFTGCGTFLLLVGLATAVTGTVTGVTFGGVAGVQHTSVSNTGPTPDLNISWWAWTITQAAPTGTLVVTHSGTLTGANCTMAFYKCYNVGSFGTPVNSQGNSTGTTDNVAVNEGGTIISLRISSLNSAAVTYTGTDIQEDFGPTGYRLTMAIHTFATAGTKALTHSQTSTQWVASNVVLNP
jgi:hypothetical protein